MYGRELRDVIDEEIRLGGYFVIITSEKMTAAQALELYKSRDASEKLFRGDKSYLGNKSFRVHTSESIQAKIFIEFVALIIRSRFYTCLKKQMQKGGKKNYMTVPAAIRELEKIVWIIVCTANMHINQIRRETNLLQIPHWMRSGFVKDRNLHFIMISGMIGCSQSRCQKSVKFRGILSLALLSQKVGFNSIQTGMKMSLTKNNVMLTSGES